MSRRSLAEISVAEVEEAQGLIAFLNRRRPFVCELKGGPLDRWMEGYTLAAVSEFRRHGAGSAMFPVKLLDRQGQPWLPVETRFLVAAFSSALPVRVIAGCLGRSERGVRVAAHALDLERRKVFA